MTHVIWCQMTKNDDYKLLDSGDGEKLERFGKYVLARPCAQAVWKKNLAKDIWQKADATFTRIDDKRWSTKGSLPKSWQMQTEGITFKIAPTEFGHLGIFAEQKPFWKKISDKIKEQKAPVSALNLFAYSGGATMACAKAGAKVCHLDASKGMVSWARENAALNTLESAPIRWIVEDVQKFIEREIKRESHYDVIILDPPSFGRGAKGELFKIEAHIIPLLQSLKKLLTKEPLCLLFSCHTPGFTPIVLEQLLKQTFGSFKGSITSGEMLLESTFSIQSGAYAYIDFKP